jgi:hypothetical protein
MEIISSHKGQTVKTAVVRMPADAGQFPNTHDAAARFAMDHFNETPARLMDWDTDQYEDGLITVRLYTA